MADSLLKDAFRELELAHLVIRNALNLMTPEQKKRWAEQNEAAGCCGEGTTRANERAEIIAALLSELKRVDSLEAQAKEIWGDDASKIVGGAHHG